MGRVYWITGLSGAGKTTIGKLLFTSLKAKKENIIRLDGDELRYIFNNSDYSYEGRKRLGFQYSRLCKMLADQDNDVIICTIAMFDDVRAWNRENIDDYFEIYLEVTLDELVKRDYKGVYAGKISGKKNIYGLDLKVEYPKEPNLIIRNYGDVLPEDAIKLILDAIDKE